MKIYAVKREWYNIGIMDASTNFGHTMKVYSIERTICDIFRPSNNLILSDRQTALKEYLSRKEKENSHLMEYAAIFHVEQKLRDYLEIRDAFVICTAMQLKALVKNLQKRQKCEGNIMATTTNYTCRMDTEVKSKSEALYGELGMNLSTAINVFLRESLRVGGFPFAVRLPAPNAETVGAMREAERIGRDSNTRALEVEEALRELKK